jgi:hypothetical protein
MRERILKLLAVGGLAVMLATQCGTGSTGGGSFKWYGSHPPVVNHRCEYLGEVDGTQVWECRPL